jgi:hypothetical protein
MAEQTGALFRFYEYFEIGGLLAPDTAPQYVYVKRLAVR